jgi:transmembrane sensor
MVDEPDLMQQIANAGARMDTGLSDRDVERLVAGGGRRRRRRRLRRLALAGAAMGGIGLAVVLGTPRAPGPAPLTTSVPLRADRPTAEARTLRLADGSTATPLDATSEIAVADPAAEHLGLTLARGRARFQVTRNPARSFVVRAGGVTVTVIGTVFTVERVADRVGVSVERGTVRVGWGVGTAVLGEGQSGWYPPLVVSTAGAPKPAPARPASARPQPAVAAPDSVVAPPVRESAEQLLLQADRERLAGRAEAGVELLRRLLRDHGDDPRAPLAAFTLGRVLLIDLARPQEAAVAFAEVRRLSAGGPFAEDALAREVEAWSKAGQAARARERAQEYLREYPGGRRASAVRAMGGVE